MALSANTLRSYETETFINEFGVKASSVIYEGSAVGSSAGYARALVAGDTFLGFSIEKVTGGSSDGDNNVRVRTEGRVQLSVTSVAVTDIGADVYASDDGTFGLTQGFSSVRVGRVHRYISSGVAIVEFNANPAVSRNYSVVSIPIALAGVTAADVVTTWTPGFAGRIEKIDFAVTTVVTTAAKLASLNMEIGTTNLTGGVVALTSANCATLGAVVAGSAITAANAFTATDTLSIEAASVTAFAEGAGVLLITISTPAK